MLCVMQKKKGQAGPAQACPGSRVISVPMPAGSPMVMAMGARVDGFKRVVLDVDCGGV